jgi:hypothetical protein
VVIRSIIEGKHPTRPNNVRWLPDNIWEMLVKCWNERRCERPDASAVRSQFLAPSDLVIAKGELEEIIMCEQLDASAVSSQFLVSSDRVTGIQRMLNKMMGFARPKGDGGASAGSQTPSKEENCTE